MYAGITQLKAEKNEKNDYSLLGMRSREGEEVDFENKISIAEDSRINIWLGKVDDQMRFCLATKLENAIKQITSIEGDKSKEEELLKIIERDPA
jgi:dynein heavy chain 1